MAGAESAPDDPTTPPEEPTPARGGAPAPDPSEPHGAGPDIASLRLEIDRLDAEILAAVKRRAEVSRVIGRTRMAEGGTRLVHNREMAVIERYSELGQEGHTLAMLLLRLGRGRLGH